MGYGTGGAPGKMRMIFPVGSTVNAFCSVSLDPPLVLWCLDRKSDRFRTFTGPGHHTISVLGTAHETVSTRLARQGAHDLDGIALIQTEIELLRALIYRAGEALVAGEDVTKLATMAKLKAGRLGRELTDACLQFWGGMGFMNETPVSRAYRDSRLTSIGGGADEVMLMVLCKMMGTLPNMNQKS